MGFMWFTGFTGFMWFTGLMGFWGSRIRIRALFTFRRTRRGGDVSRMKRDVGVRIALGAGRPRYSASCSAMGYGRDLRDSPSGGHRTADEPGDDEPALRDWPA